MFEIRKSIITLTLQIMSQIMTFCDVFYRIHVTQYVGVQVNVRTTKTYIHYKVFYSDVHVNDILTKFKEYSSVKHKLM